MFKADGKIMFPAGHFALLSIKTPGKPIHTHCHAIFMCFKRHGHFARRIFLCVSSLSLVHVLWLSGNIQKGFLPEDCMYIHS